MQIALAQRRKRLKFVAPMFFLIVLLMVLAPISAFAADFSIPSADKGAYNLFLSNLQTKGEDYGVANLPSATSTSNTTGELDIKGVTKNSSTKKGEKVTVIKGDNQGKITFNAEEFKMLTDKEQRRILNDFVRGLQASDISKQTQQSLYDRMNESSPEVSRLLIPMLMDASSADVYGAMRIVDPFMPFLRVILGIIAIGVVFSLGFFTAMDLFFIGIPFFRDRMQNRGDEKGGGKIPFVSYDAVSVVNETESGTGEGGYKNPIIMYFKRRVITFIAVGVCLVYLVFGGLGALFSGFMSLFSGFTM